MTLQEVAIRSNYDNARAAQDSEQWDQMILYGVEMLNIARTLPDNLRSVSVEALHILNMAYYETEQYHKVIECSIEAQEIYSRLFVNQEESHRVVDIIIYYGAALYNNGNAQDAMLQFERAIELSQQLRNESPHRFWDECHLQQEIWLHDALNENIEYGASSVSGESRESDSSDI